MFVGVYFTVEQINTVNSGNVLYVCYQQLQRQISPRLQLAKR